MNAFFHALTFLTRIPVPFMRSDDADWKRSTRYYPLVGLVIGLVLWCFFKLMILLFSPLLAALLTLTCWVYLTGGLHLDGWMDLADGLGSNRPRERVLEIMKDSRVGAMGVLAVISLLGVKSMSLYEVLTKNPLWLLVIPTVARMYMLSAIYFWPYLTKNGIGSGMKEGLQLRHLMMNLVFLIGVAYWIGHIQGLVVIAFTLLGSIWFTHRTAKRLTGLTGDCYGALIEWNEVVCLLFVLATEKWFG